MFRWQGFGALGGSIFSPPGDASGTSCWELPTDDGCASPGIAPGGGFRVSGIRSLVPWPGSGAQGSRASGWGTASGVPCPSSVCWGSTAWAAPHCHFAPCACARACGLTVQVAQATKEEEVSCGEGWGACRQGVLALPSAGALRGRLPPASWWAHGDCPWGCLGGGDPNGGVSRSQWTGSSCRGTCLFLSGDVLTTCRGRYGGGSVSRGTGSAGGSCSCSYGTPFTTGHGGCEPQPDLVVCHGQGVDRWSCGFIGSSWVGTSWATFCAEVGCRHEAPRLSLLEPRQGKTSGEELNSWSSRSHRASSACSSVRWRPQGYVPDPEVACRADERAWGLPGGCRSTSGAILALLGSGDGFRDPSDDCGVYRGFVLRSYPRWCPPRMKLSWRSRPLPSVMAMPQGWHLAGDCLLFPLMRIGCWTLMPLLHQGGLGRHQGQPKTGVGLRRPRHRRPPPWVGLHQTTHAAHTATVGLLRTAATGCTSMQWCICHGMSSVRSIALCAIRHSAIRLYVRITYDRSIRWSQRPRMSSTFSWQGVCSSIWHPLCVRQPRIWMVC